jgi:dihydroflavonol-4-reductase
MKTFVTGATGFVGSSIVRRLIEDGKAVKAFIRRNADLGAINSLQGLDVEVAYGDITDADSVQRAMKDCDVVYHVAAMVAFWAPRKQRSMFYRVNVDGSKNVFAAALRRGVERVVYTSTASTIGSYGKDCPTTEEHDFNLWDMSSDYERSKYSAEFEASRFVARGLPLVCVLPAAPIGPRDSRPNPGGKLILDFLARKIPGYIDGGANFIHVDDVADGHLLAAKLGKTGERYLLGAANLSIKDLFSALEDVSGIAAPKLKLPYGGALALAYGLEFFSDYITNTHPLLTVPMVKYSGLHYYLDTSKAQRELGFQPKRSVKQAAFDAIRWFLEHGYIKLADGAVSRIRNRLAEQSPKAAMA